MVFTGPSERDGQRFSEVQRNRRVGMPRSGPA